MNTSHWESLRAERRARQGSHEGPEGSWRWPNGGEQSAGVKAGMQADGGDGGEGRVRVAGNGCRLEKLGVAIGAATRGLGVVPGVATTVALGCEMEDAPCETFTHAEGGKETKENGLKEKELREQNTTEPKGKAHLIQWIWLSHLH